MIRSKLPSAAAFRIAHCTQTGHCKIIALCALFIVFPLWALGQQIPPLQGQGLSPLEANFSNYIGNPVPVFVSVDLLKLQNIDDREYEFNAILNVEQTWFDPRAAAAFRIIDERDLLRNGTNATNVYINARDCGNISKSQLVNLTSEDCVAALNDAPVCTKYCTTYAGTTDNRFRCCDLLWLPGIDMPNLIDTSQDRTVFDTVFSFELAGRLYVHRVTRITGHFFTPLKFQDYPFDNQRLFVFLQSNTPLAFKIVPSASFRHLLPEISYDNVGEPKFSGLEHDELPGWNIRNISLDCTTFTIPLDSNLTSGDTTAPKLTLQTQDYDKGDPTPKYNGEIVKILSGIGMGAWNESICAVTVQVDRLSSTLVVQSVVPVAFVGCIAFVVFFSAPDALDLRLGTEISLFLSLTAVQFIFVSMLPLTSYLTNFDVFILLTYCTIVAIVLESLVVYYISTRVEVAERRTSSNRKEEEKGLTASSFSEKNTQIGVHPLAHISSGQVLTSFPESEGDLAPNEMHLEESDDIRSGDTPSKDGHNKPLMRTDLDESMRVSKGMKALKARTLPISIPNGAGLKPLATAIQKTDARFVSDPGFAYRIACKIDAAAGAVLFFVYILLSILNFAVGFT